MDTKQLEEIKEGWWSLSQMVHPNEEIIGEADIYITQLIHALEEEMEKNSPGGKPKRPEGRKMAEWKRELRETQEEYARLEKQRDELGDSLHNQSPGAPALDGYTPTWARGKP